MYIGIDLGTSGVKAILLNEQGDVVASQTEKLTVSRPHPLWSEQDPEQWWLATDRAVKALGQQHTDQIVHAAVVDGNNTKDGALTLTQRREVHLVGLHHGGILRKDKRCQTHRCRHKNALGGFSRRLFVNLIFPHGDM